MHYSRERNTPRGTARDFQFGMESRSNSRRTDKIYDCGDTNERDQSECANYRTLSLMNHLLKMFLLIVLKRLQERVEPFLAEEQAGFRKYRTTVQ